MPASLLLDLWYRSMVRVGVAYGVLLVAMVVCGVLIRALARRANTDPMSDVHALLGDQDEEGDQRPRPGAHRAVPRQRLAVTR